jgi:hypothetical protein
MSNPWFRFYHRAIDDEKLRLLAFEDRWHFVGLLCLKASGLLDEPPSDLRRRKVAIKIGVSPDTLDEIIRRLAEVGLIDAAWNPIAWDALQFTGDSSTDRVRKHREKKKLEAVRNENETSTRRVGNVSETPMKRYQPVSVTPPDTETESDPDSDPDRYSDKQSSFARDTRNHTALADIVASRRADICAAAGITDETRTPGLLSLAEPIRWLERGCDIDLDIIPTLQGMALRGRPITSWAYCSQAIFDAHSRRMAPPPPIEALPSRPPPIRRRTIGEAGADVIRKLREQEHDEDVRRNRDSGGHVEIIPPER